MQNPSSDQQQIEHELATERERLRITLSSIGDAVICTDAEGRVSFLNGVAEELTGWSHEDAEGQPLTDVFVIVHEESRQPVDNPALRALQEGRIVGLANHTLLISRDGTERPIDDSAAPMRDAAGNVIGTVLVFRDVTEQRGAQVARARLAAIVESSDDAIISKTLDGIIRSWNKGAERIFGYTSAEAVGQPITMIIPPEMIDEERQILARLRAGERIDHFETTRVGKFGRRLDISLTVSPVKDSDGRIIGASKIARDITDRKRAETVLRESESRHRFLATLAAETQPLADPEEMLKVTTRLLAEHLQVDRCAYAEVENETTFVIAGDYTRGVPSIVGRWPVAAFGPELERLMLINEPFVIDDVDQDARSGFDLTAYRQTNIRAVICVPLRKDGRFAAAMAVHQQTPRHWTPAEIDLVRTVVARSWEALERARVSRSLQETADRLSLALAAASMGDWSWNTATDVVTLSERAAEIFGIPAGPYMTWSRLQMLIHPDDRERTVLAVDAAVAANLQYDTEYRVLHPTGEVWVSAKGRAVYDAQGRVTSMYGMLQDITQAKQLEQMLRHRAELLADADRKKDDFIALLAHELRNPLAPIRSGLQVMRLAAGDLQAVDQARQMMDRQLSHMVRLIDDLLDVSRINRNKLHLQKNRLPLAEIIHHAVEASQPAVLAAGHELSLSLPATPIYLDADLTRLAQVFANLIHNSVKYTEPPGRIWVSAEVISPNVIVSVRDTGIGIPAEELPRIFDMFSQADRATERVSGGLGIGLALVKGLVEMHGGSVAVESPGSGQGSTFTVSLPLAADGNSAPPPSVSPQTSQTPRTTSLKVLVVDDNRDGAEAMARMLALLGNQVEKAHDGIEALEIAEKMQPDAILMDIGMPRLNGLEATRQIREQDWGRRVRIIALTGWGQDGDRQRSEDAGCDGHLVKPVSFSTMENLLDEIAASRGQNSR